MLASRYIEIFILLVGGLLAIYVGSWVVMLPIPIMAIFAAAIFVILWALVAGSAWWVPIISGATILGMFKVGVKVSPTLVAFGLCIVGILPVILVQGERALQRHRRALPFIFYATAIFIGVRLVIDIIPAHERSNLFRVLFDATWPFVFGFLFHHYGSLNTARLAVGAAFVVLMIRCMASIFGYLSGLPVYIPGIDYLLSLGSGDSLIALRTVALNLMMITMVMYHSTKTPFFRFLLAPVLACSAALTVMGGSRFSALMMFVLVAAFFGWSRRWWLFFVASVFSIGFFAFINVQPQVLDQMPPVAQRALSGLVVGHENSGIHEATGSSDEWHDAMRAEGFKRWTQSPLTFLFGYGIRPTPFLYEDVKTYEQDPTVFVNLAADVGSYECGLWTMLALFGVVGTVLYTLVFIYFWKQTVPYFFRKPEGTFWEGLLFWGCYSSIIYYAAGYFQGSFPSFELVMLILAADAIQDGKLEREEAQEVSISNEAPRLAHVGYARSRS